MKLAFFDPLYRPAKACGRALQKLTSSQRLRQVPARPPQTEGPPRLSLPHHPAPHHHAGGGPARAISTIP